MHPIRLKCTALLLAILAPAGCVQAPPHVDDPARDYAPPRPSPNPLGAARVVEETYEGQNLVISLPATFDPASADRYPLVVFFHSYDQDARQMTKLTRFARLSADLGWIAASGDLAGPSHWGNPRAIAMHQAMLRRLRERYPIDDRRIYYAGFSMGGGTALLAALATKGTPDAPAAIATSQGWTDLARMREAKDGMYAASIDAAYGGALSESARARTDLVARAGELVGIPLYMEHGDADQYVPVTHSERLKAALDAAGVASTFKIFGGLGHNEATIHEGVILDFFKDKRRP
ncbi:MAG TPA: PHB depolymerase family esterase [Pantanalinema sp.]